ncbi:acyl-[acyl-carrier-protein] thioesterase [Thermodesulfobacteriota bacterium]
MKITLHKQVKYFEVDAHFKLKLGHLFKLLQEAAIEHSEKVGLGSKTLVDTGSVWVLNRMEAEVLRSPEYLENLTVVTWHKGSKGYRAYRDFIVYAGDEKVAVASSRWLYFDMQHKRIVRIPEETSAAYTTETESAFDNQIDTWKADSNFSPTVIKPISIRTSDYDPLGHVNNAIYFDYVETLAAHAFEDFTGVSRLKIEFKKELGQEIETVETGLAEAQDGHVFKIFNRDTVYAAGALCLSS